MESFRHHHRSPGSERFLGAFSASPPSPSGGGGASLGAELLEDDVLFSPSPERQHQHSTPPAMPSNPSPNPISILSPRGGPHRRGLGILAALPDDGVKKPPVDPPIHQRRPSLSSSSSASSASPSPSPSSSAARAIPSIPKPKPEYSLSMPSGKIYHQSAPVNVPVARPRRPSRAEMEGVGDEDGDDDEMLPPHEMVARASARNAPVTTFSVLEGVGRTLKGRDLRRVRNAVFRQTGFLD